MRCARRRLADEWRERAPCGDAEDHERLKRLDGLEVASTVRRERCAHLSLELTEDRPSVDHAGDVPFPRTAARFVEVLPHTASEDVLEVRITVDRLLRQRRRHQAVRRIAQDLAGLTTHETRDAQSRRTRIKAAQGAGEELGVLMERAQRRARFRR